MLDRLLGRASLKERIAELEAERESLQAQLEAEEERRADAVADRQAAQERVNRLEDRIADLEGKVDEESDGDGGDDLRFRRRESVAHDRAGAVLDRLESFDAGEEGALTVALDGDAAAPDALREVLGERVPLADRAAPCVVVADDAGLVAAALAPPRQPDPFVTWADGFAVEREWIEPMGSFAFALVRSDTFAYGTYEGAERVAFEGFESEVTADHSKGGFSQGRFERRRDGEIASHLDRCQDVIDERDPERLFVVGERTVLGEFEDVANATATVDATGSSESALDDAFRDFWTTTVYGLSATHD